RRIFGLTFANASEKMIRSFLLCSKRNKLRGEGMYVKRYLYNSVFGKWIHVMAVFVHIDSIQISI
ncbi:MAG: hypothetical protein ACI4EH_04410, partial [Oliverpabstia sp.]